MAEPIYYFDSEEDARRALKIEGKRLQSIAVSIWRQYMQGYQPVMYVRKLNADKSIKLGGVKRLGANTFGIELTFVDDLAYHNSIFNNDKKTHPQGHAIMLISEGWKAKKLEKYLGRRVHRLTYFEGINYVQRVKEAFEGGAMRGIVLEVQWAGKEFKKQPKQPKVLR